LKHNYVSFLAEVLGYISVERHCRFPLLGLWLGVHLVSLRVFTLLGDVCLHGGLLTEFAHTHRVVGKVHVGGLGDRCVDGVSIGVAAALRQAVGVGQDLHASRIHVLIVSNILSLCG